MYNDTMQISLEIADVCVDVEDCESCKFYKYCVNEAVANEAA